MGSVRSPHSWAFEGLIMNIKILIIVYCVLLLQSCGGGSPTETLGSLPITETLGSLPIKDTSYENFKEVGLTPQILPSSRSGVGTIRAFGDFSQSGRLDLFTATLTYWPPTTPEMATPSTFEIWRKQANGTFAKDSLLLQNSNNGCVHPRKALVADFNLDSRPDIFVVCHGFDASPFPGEKNKIVLSQNDGTYFIQDAATDVGFFHSGSAADLNYDGLPDVILTNNFDSASALILLNQGNGTFQREVGQRLPSSIGGKNYFTVELVDIDGDELLDIVLGGHEWEGADTVVFINPGDNFFDSVTPIVIPSVSNEGVVLDFAITNIPVRTLWLLRTSGGDGTFYQSRVIQKVLWQNLFSTTPLIERPAQWFQWILPATVNAQSVITSEDASVGVSLVR
jgi:hypothetical protein